MHANGATHSPPLKSNSDTIESVVVGVMSVRAWSLRACYPTTSARFLNGDLDLRRTQKAKFSFSRQMMRKAISPPFFTFESF